MNFLLIASLCLVLGLHVQAGDEIEGPYLHGPRSSAKSSEVSDFYGLDNNPDFEDEYGDEYIGYGVHTRSPFAWRFSNYGRRDINDFELGNYGLGSSSAYDWYRSEDSNGINYGRGLFGNIGQRRAAQNDWYNFKTEHFGDIENEDPEYGYNHPSWPWFPRKGARGLWKK